MSQALSTIKLLTGGRKVRKIGTVSPEIAEQIASLDQVQRDHIVNALRATKGNKRRAAQILKISRGTLYRRLRLYGLTHLVRDPLQGLK